MNILAPLTVKAHVKHALLSLALPVLILASCATPHYHALHSRPPENWQGSSSKWGGYTETKHSNGDYTVGFESYNRPSQQATDYFSLVRAAERAAIDGKKSFYLKASPVETKRQVSRFPAYVIPGYTEVRTVVHKNVDRHGHVHYHTHEICRHHPDRYVPPRKATNSIFTSQKKLSYTKKLSAEFDTFKILDEAHRNIHGYGRPKLDPRAKAQMKTWRKR